MILGTKALTYKYRVLLIRVLSIMCVDTVSSFLTLIGPRDSYMYVMCYVSVNVSSGRFGAKLMA